MSFKDAYIKTEIHSNMDVAEGVCGIAENIDSQWENKSKAVGMFNNDTYLFGSTTEFSTDHVYIIDQMTSMLGQARFMVTVQESGSRVSVWIRPAHSGTVLEGEFEKRIVREILNECLEAFSRRPDGTEMRVDLEMELLDTQDVLLTRSKDIDGLKKQIEHIIK